MGGLIVPKSEDIKARFKFYPATTAERGQAHQAARDTLRDAALVLSRFVPEGREFSLVLTNLEQAMFWANAAIARQPEVE